MNSYNVYTWERLERYTVSDFNYPYNYRPVGDKQLVFTLEAKSYNDALCKARKWAKRNKMPTKLATVKRVR